MANQEMIKRAYAEGAYAALKEAGYDDQTAAYYANEMAKQAEGPFGQTGGPTPSGDIYQQGKPTGILAKIPPRPPLSPRQQAALANARGPKGLVPPDPSKLPPPMPR
jgi:hypothetical protein